MAEGGSKLQSLSSIDGTSVAAVPPVGSAGLTRVTIVTAGPPGTH